MKHPASQELFSYWDRARGTAAAPDRSAFDPQQVRRLLGDIFVLSCDPRAGYPFRVAGTRLCALLGRDLKDESFTDLFHRRARREMLDILDVVTEDVIPVATGLTARSPDATQVHLELVLLPFNARWQTPLSLTGLLVPMTPIDPSLYGGWTDFGVTSWRHITQERRGPREIHRWPSHPGLTVYEGLR